MIGYVDGTQIGTAVECIFLDAGHAFGNLKGFQSFTVIESIIGNGDDTVGNHTVAPTPDEPVCRCLNYCMTVVSGIIYRVSVLHIDILQLFVRVKHIFSD